MKRRIRGELTLCGLLLALAMPLLAHHPVESEFDTSKEQQLTGVLTRVDWANPHVHLMMDVKDQSGKTTQLTVEGVGSSELAKAGLMRNSLEAGKTYTVTAFPAKDGSPKAFLKNITLPDGKSVTAWSGDPNGVSATASTSSPGAASSLPQTASPLPLIALLGLGALSTGMIARLRRSLR